METRVKERLVGAAILVGLIVILVPELLSGPKSPMPGAAHSGDAALQTYTIDLSAPGRIPQHAPQPVQTETKPAEVQEAQPSAAAAAATQPDAPESKPPQSEPTPEGQPESKSAVEPEVKSELRHTVEPPSRPIEPRQGSTSTQRPQSPPPATKAAPAPATKSAGWAVQLGSFAGQENAKRLVGELRAKGYKAFISTVGSGTKARYRVRVGPEPGRPQAEKLAERLKREGRQVTVVSHP